MMHRGKKPETKVNYHRFDAESKKELKLTISSKWANVIFSWVNYGKATAATALFNCSCQFRNAYTYDAGWARSENFTDDSGFVLALFLSCCCGWFFVWERRAKCARRRDENVAMHRIVWRFHNSVNPNKCNSFQSPVWYVIFWISHDMTWYFFVVFSPSTAAWHFPSSLSHSRFMLMRLCTTQYHNIGNKINKQKQSRRHGKVITLAFFFNFNSQHFRKTHTMCALHDKQMTKYSTFACNLHLKGNLSKKSDCSVVVGLTVSMWTILKRIAIIS